LARVLMMLKNFCRFFTKNKNQLNSRSEFAECSDFGKNRHWCISPKPSPYFLWELCRIV
jgi:hypothetical protein